MRIPLRFALFASLLFVVVARLAAADGASTNAVRALSLADCIQMAVEHNLDIQINRFTPQIAVGNLTIAEAGFEPTFNLSYLRTFNRSGGQAFNPVTQTPSFGSETDTDQVATSISGTTPYTGLQYRMSMNAQENAGLRDAGTGITNFSTAVGNLQLNLTQPLLRNAWIDQTRFRVLVQRNRLKFTEWALRNVIITTVTSVENAYYDLIFARENVRVQEKALELAERLLAENKKRVEVGALAPLDEKQAESQVAARRADLLNAQRIYLQANNSLRTLLTDDYARLQSTELDPADVLTPVVRDLDLQESWRHGMELRPDLQQAKLDLEQQGIQLRFNRNQTYPQLDLTGSYAFGASGGRTVTFSDVFGHFTRGDLPAWSFGAVFSIPLGNTAARQNYRNSKLSVEQALLTVKKIEQDVMVQVDNAIQLARKEFLRIESTRLARQYAEAALEAEQTKLANGKSTSFVVLQLQRDFITARSEEIRALADYNKALAQLAQQEGSTLVRRNISVDVR